jgi:hypothetical protein
MKLWRIKRHKEKIRKKKMRVQSHSFFELEMSLNENKICNISAWPNDGDYILLNLIQIIASFLSCIQQTTHFCNTSFVFETPVFHVI